MQAFIIALSLFTVLLIAIAISKLVMYIDIYGLSVTRVYAAWFIVLIAIFFVLVILREFMPEFRFYTIFSVAFCIMFLEFPS